MSAAGRLKYAYLAYFSKPRELRGLYRLLRREQPLRIVELGVRSIRDTVRMLEVATRYQGDAQIQYTAIDAFDARGGDQERLSLKEAHRVLKATGAKVRLLPGMPYQTLPAVANTLLKTDLLIISVRDKDANDPIGQAWFFVPRMLSEQAIVLRRSEGNEEALRLDHVEREEIDRLAVPPRRRAA